jgi:acyl carrier protein
MSEIANTVLMLLLDVRPEVDFLGSADFIREGVLDSYDLVTIVSALDGTFNISIEGEDVVPENFCSLKAIGELLSKYGISEKA